MSGRKIDPPDFSTRTVKRLTPEEIEFVHECINRGLTNQEATRKVFRAFGRDLSSCTVARYRIAGQP